MTIMRRRITAPTAIPETAPIERPGLYLPNKELSESTYRHRNTYRGSCLRGNDLVAVVITADDKGIAGEGRNNKLTDWKSTCVTRKERT